MKHACERISQLTSDALERKLSIVERFSMGFHFLLCSACEQYHENMRKLHQALQLQRERNSKNAKLPPDKREAITQTLQTLHTTRK